MDRMVITGFLLMAAMMFMLLRTKVRPALVFSVLPLIAGVGLGFSPSALLRYITGGMETVLPVAAMFGCAILFFGLLESAGVFAWLTGILKARMKHSACSVMLFTVLISIIAHLSGSGAVSYLIVANACRDVYAKNNIPVVKLMCLCSLTFGIMNMTPWGGPCGRLAAVLRVSPAEIWSYCIPVQLAGLGMVFLIAVFMSKGTEEVKAEEKAEEVQRAERPPRLVLNVILLAAVLVLLVCVSIQPFVIFGIGAIILMLINFKGIEHLRQTAGKCMKQAWPMMITVTATGVLTGVFTQSPLLDSMTEFFGELLPRNIADHAHILLGALSNPISWFVIGEVQIFGLVPIVSELVRGAGIPAAATGAAFLIPYSAAVFVLPTTVSVHLGISVCGVTMREHVRETYKWTLLCSLGMLAFAVITGILPF